MRERKFVKFRVDMYEDTKSKIIDMKPERDVIHYIWTRLVILAGKVNREGELYMSKNIPYTIETLAIEFNRNVDQVKLALDVFMELEMIEVDDENVYVVKNFAKHQNIKVKEKVKSKEREEERKNGEVSVIENLGLKDQAKIEDSRSEEVNITENIKSQIKIDDRKDKDSKKKVDQNQPEGDGDHIDNDELSIQNKDVTKVDKIIINNKDSTDTQNKIPISLEKNKRKKTKINKKKEFNIKVIEEDPEDNRLVRIYDSDEERPLENGESVVSTWAF